jgi:hypothetical protein
VRYAFGASCRFLEDRESVSSDRNRVHRMRAGRPRISRVLGIAGSIPLVEQSG